MRSLKAIIALIAALANVTHAQQYVGDVIPNSLPVVPGSEITYFRINDPSGKNKNLTLTNYYSHGKNTAKRLVEANIQRAVIIIHGLNRDPGTYMSNMLSALAQTTPSNPDVNFDTVAIMAPYFPNGDDKGKGYPWTDGLSAGKGSTSNALVWKASQWSAGANNQYPSTSKNTSSYTVLDQIVQYFDNATVFPNMNQIVVAGHSLGGQTVHRYAALGAQLNTRSPVSYWVGNPNSYVWLSTDRPLPTTGCPDYDDYRDGYSTFADYPMTYGLGLVNAGRAAILANYNSKAVNYGRGTQDLGDDSTTCAPRTTGKDRNERFFNFIKAFPPSCSDPKGRNCDTVDFVNTGHDGGAMMASPAGQTRLFLDNFYGNGNRSYDFGYPRQQAGDDPYPNPALNGTAAALNNNTYAGNMTYWGCWSDQSPQTLTNMTYQSNANTIDLCTQTCASGTNSIAGMEFGTQCFCGKLLGYRAQQVIESSCQNTCPGNSSQTCGGYSRLSIFSNGRPQLQPTPGTPETVGDFTYISCYTDASSGRALTGKGTSSNTMTLEVCANYCSGYQYFGTEYGSECYCGNSFAAGANRTNDDECNMLCANDTSEFCGAGNRLTVYQNANWVASSSVSSSSGASATTSSSPGSESQPTAVSCPASNNTVTTSSGRNFTIECGIDHAGGDLTSLSVSSFQGCIDACAKNDRCVDVSLSGTACYLKSALGAAVQNGGIWGAKLVVDTGPTSSVRTSSSSSAVSISSTITASGSDSRSSTTSSTISASATISSASGTVSISSTITASTSTTQISSTTTSSTPNPSASISCPGSNSTTVTSNGISFFIECGIDHAGGDMKFLSVGGFQQCIDACATTTGCVDLSLSGDACYLKGLLGAVVRNGVWGARVVQADQSSASSTTSSVATSTTMSGAPGSGSSGTGSAGSTSSSSSTTVGSGSSSSSASTSSGLSSSATFVSSSSASSTAGNSGTASGSTSPTSSLSSTSTTQSTSSSTISPSSSISSTTSQSSSSTSSAQSSITPTATTLSTTTTTSQTSSSSALASLPSSFTSLGCYTDSNTRLLPTTNGTSNAQTPQSCALACQTRGFKYSGTEYANECWCGNILPPSSASAPASQCNMRCSGDKTQTCGAGNRISIVVDDDWKQTFFARQSYESWNLMGCYLDSGSSRTLSRTVSLFAFGGAGNATIANCLDACRAKGYTWCGGEYYSECYGSAAASTAGLAPGADVLGAGCSFPCRGNETEACGGSNRIVVYVNNGTVG